jgi:hypothetical protein
MYQAVKNAPRLTITNMTTARTFLLITVAHEGAPEYLPHPLAALLLHAQLKAYR